ncbi:MAG: leucine-rich repeat domain-containing protein, partial [Lentisphaerae bacterium]|nr:leucine-rich repeat domain-containing protein [Lentisphaerota bacterium]
MSMKRVMIALLLSVIVPNMFAATLYTNEVNGIKWVYSLADGKVTLGGGSSSAPAIASNPSGKVEIPSFLGETPVVAIASYAFNGKTGIKDLTVPNSVTNIGNCAFQNCSGVTNIVIAKGTQYIGYGAFGGCASMESLTIPFVGTRRGNSGYEATFGYMFGNNSSQGSRQIRQTYGSGSYNYATYYIPSNLVSVVVTDETRIGYGAFFGCEDLRSVTIEDGVTAVDAHAFYFCTRLEDVSLPETLSSVGSYAFKGCKSLSSETLASFPSSLKTIGYAAFSGCETALGEIVIPEGMEVIGDYAFENCYNVTNVTISSTVTNIGQNAFLNCRSITSLTVPDNVLYIGSGAFGGCASMESLTIPFVGTRRGNSGYEATFGYMFGNNSSQGS